MMAFEPAAVWQGLQEVQEGADPADIYQRLMEDAVDPEEAIMDEYLAAIEEDHDFQDCRSKFQRGSFCFGAVCQYLPGGIRIQVDCPCDCHKAERE